MDAGCPGQRDPITCFVGPWVSLAEGTETERGSPQSDPIEPCRHDQSSGQNWKICRCYFWPSRSEVKCFKSFNAFKRVKLRVTRCAKRRVTTGPECHKGTQMRETHCRGTQLPLYHCPETMQTLPFCNGLTHTIKMNSPPVAVQSSNFSLKNVPWDTLRDVPPYAGEHSAAE